MTTKQITTANLFYALRNGQIAQVRHAMHLTNSTITTAFSVMCLSLFLVYQYSDNWSALFPAATAVASTVTLIRELFALVTLDELLDTTLKPHEIPLNQEPAEPQL